MQAELNTPRGKLFIDGEWIDSQQRMHVINPFTRAAIASVAVADQRMIDAAIAAAQEAFGRTREMPPFERSAILSKIAAGVAHRKHDFARLITAEAGKPVALAEAEVDRAVTTFTVAAEEARRTTGEVLDLDAFPNGRGHTGIARRFPVGVVYGITPFNFPLNLLAHKIAPALASGNTIVVKPSPRTPLSALLLAEVISESGTPRGAVNVIIVPNELASRPLADERVKHVSFTGSVPVGWSIRQQAGPKRVTLELGGNAGLIVHEDADLDRAIPAAATGGFGYAGQSCISVQRIAVHAPIYDRFREQFLRHVEQHVHAGDPRERRTSVGPLIDDGAAARVRGLLDNARSAGARILCGGTFEGNVLHPTVLEGVDPSHEVSKGEAFAPVVTLHRYGTFDQAIAFVNDSAYGLQAGVFTRDIGRAWAAFERLEVGGVMINQIPTFRVENMPYGGIKASGLGREGVRYAMEEMTELRVMVIRIKP
jgi:acyl-CoA reductase-like NAD-dependent aldehyde dehydrogenase